MSTRVDETHTKRCPTPRNADQRQFGGDSYMALGGPATGVQESPGSMGSLLCQQSLAITRPAQCYNAKHYNMLDRTYNRYRPADDAIP
ncbi:hypothetical protein BX616_004985, partial [Lobosporangium transversale]